MGIREVFQEKQWSEVRERFSVRVPAWPTETRNVERVDERRIAIRGASHREVPPRWFASLFPVLRPVEILVAIDEDDGGRIVGEARFARTALKVFGGPSFGELYLLGLHVAPELRSSGIGSRLMKAVEQIGCAGGLLCVVLDVERENALARSLFERRGYQRRGNGERDPVELVFSGPLDQYDATPRPARRSKVMMFRYLDRDRDAGKTVWMPANA